MCNVYFGHDNPVTGNIHPIKPNLHHIGLAWPTNLQCFLKLSKKINLHVMIPLISQ
jgi:hypothetical protein